MTYDLSDDFIIFQIYTYILNELLVGFQSVPVFGSHFTEHSYIWIFLWNHLQSIDGHLAPVGL
jgi:hypothetical protein